MKFIILLTLLLGIAVALETTGLEERVRRPRKRTPRPRKSIDAGTLRAPNRPPKCPAEYKTATGKPSRRGSKAALKRVPPEFVDPGLQRRRESAEVLQRLRRQATASDFFECTTPVSSYLASYSLFKG
jgi:hypothetical protein